MRADIEKFFSGNHYAIIGASTGRINMGRTILREMLKRGFTMYPVHCTANIIEGLNCYKSVNDLPNNIDGVIFVIPADETEKIINVVADKGIKRVWMQLGSSSEKAINICKERGIEVTSNECVLMFLEKSGFPHNFHRWIWKLIGRF